MKLVDLKQPDGTTLWINADHVATLAQTAPGVVTINMGGLGMNWTVTGELIDVVLMLEQDDGS